MLNVLRYKPKTEKLTMDLGHFALASLPQGYFEAYEWPQSDLN